MEIEGNIDLNFSRDKYIDAAIKESFQMLMSKILVSSDLDKLKNIKLKIKFLVLMKISFIKIG